MIPAYNDVLRELNIELIDTKNPQKCNSNLVKFKNEGLKIQKLQEIKGLLSYITLLRYYHNFYYCIFTEKKEVLHVIP